MFRLSTKKKNYEDKYHTNKKEMKKLGQGGYGTVFALKARFDDKWFALKERMSGNYNDHMDAIQEGIVGQCLSHSNMTKIYETYSFCITNEDGEQTYKTLYIMDLGQENLIKASEDQKFDRSEGNILKLLKQALRALLYMKANNVFHRDIKPQNILVYQDGQIKLCDYGISKIVDNLITQMNSTSMAASPIYCSPLIVKMFQGVDNLPKHDIEKSDVYSLGLTFLQVALNLKNHEICDLNKEFNQNKLKAFILQLSKQYNILPKLFVRMLTYEQPERFTFEECLQFILKELNEEDEEEDGELNNEPVTMKRGAQQQQPQQQMQKEEQMKKEREEMERKFTIRENDLSRRERELEIKIQQFKQNQANDSYIQKQQQEEFQQFQRQLTQKEKELQQKEKEITRKQLELQQELEKNAKIQKQPNLQKQKPIQHLVMEFENVNQFLNESLSSLQKVTELDLCFGYKRMGDKQADNVMSKLVQLENVNKLQLSLSDNNLSDACAVQVTEKLAKMRSIEDLDLYLGQNNLSDGFIVPASKQLGSMENLQKLEFYVGDNQITNTGATSASQNLMKMKNLKNLTLYLSGNKLNDNQKQAIYDQEKMFNNSRK